MPFFPGVRPRPIDPYWEQVVMLLHFDGAGGSTDIIDSSKYARAMENNNAQLDAAEKKFGTASVYFDGGSDYIVPDDNAGPELVVGLQDFTVEFFFAKDRTSPQIMFDARPGGEPNTNFAIGLNNNNTLQAVSLGVQHNSVVVVPDTQWRHVAWSRIGGTSRIFFDGVAAISFADTANYSASSVRRPIMGNSYGGGADYRGWMDELRWTIGTGRYYVDFTPPTEAFPNGYA